MENFIATLVVLGIALLVLYIIAPHLFGKPGPVYKKHDGLFTPAELRFLHVLCRVLPEDTMVFGKVRVADVLKPVSETDKKAWRNAFNKITAKHLDFVLCNRDSGQFLCAIELNDRSHERRDRKERDRFLSKACDGADFPLLMLPAARDYDAAAIRKQILDAIGNRATSETSSPPRPAALSQHSDGECPRCGGALVRKRAKRGKQAGQRFLACSHYPRCRYTNSTG